MKRPWKTRNMFQISIATLSAIALNSVLSTVGSNEQLPGFIRMGAYLLIPVVIGAGFYVMFSWAKAVDERNNVPAPTMPVGLCRQPKQLRAVLFTIGLVLEAWLLYLVVRDVIRGSWVTCGVYGVAMVITAVGVVAARKFSRQ